MKIILSILIVAFLGMGLAVTVGATPIYLTFSGQVSSITGNNSNDWTGHSVGETVSYVYLVDFDLQGTNTRFSGAIDTKNDTAEYNWFYSDFISGSLVEELNGGFYNTLGDISEINTGYHYFSPSKVEVRGESWDEYTGVSSTSSNPWNGWDIGEYYDGTERAYASTGAHIELYSRLQLSAVQTPEEYFGSMNAVPEPATMALFGIGLLGIAGVSRRKK